MDSASDVGVVLSVAFLITADRMGVLFCASCEGVTLVVDASQFKVLFLGVRAPTVVPRRSRSRSWCVNSSVIANKCESTVV